MISNGHIDALERISQREVGRNIAPLAAFTKGDLARAAHSIVACDSPCILLVTGFYIADAFPPAAETDGPIAAVHLASAFTEIGIPIAIVTDSLCESVLQAAKKSIGGKFPLEIVDVYRPDALKTLLPRQPSHIIFIERVGPAKDGICRNMRGQDVSQYTAPLHLLTQQPGIISIGIGDGGNEVGMAKIPRQIIAQNITHGETIACQVACDYLLVCGISNWGAIALLAAVALLDHRFIPTLQETRQLHQQILHDIVKAGAVDGVKRKAIESIDGVSPEHYGNILDEMTAILEIL